MKNFLAIDKKVGSAYPLKYFFAPASHEFGTITIVQKFENFRAVVSSGYSTYDLSEKFRSDRSERYSHEDMHHVLTRYISIILFENYDNPYVQKFSKMKQTKP